MNNNTKQLISEISYLTNSLCDEDVILFFKEKKYKKIVNLIHVNAIDPKTGLPHPENRIISAMDEAKVKIDDLKKPEDQINDMANRRSISKEQLKKWLASSLR